MNLFTSLRYVVALHEHKHFGRAAQACHISQPALSNALRTLEEEFGTAIVKRGRVFEGFTPEGEQIFQAAQRILHEQERLKQELKSAEGSPQGTLRIGAVPSVMPIAARFAAMLQARHPGILPIVRSMSSPDIETGLENLSLDMGLGYMERLSRRRMPFQTLPQYTEHYFLLRRAAGPAQAGLQIGSALNWADAARLPLCLLTPEMHNRSIVDAALTEAGAQVVPAMETDSVLALALSVLDGQVCSILPGALVGAIRGFGELEAAPLVNPTVTTPIGFMVLDTSRPTRALSAALALAQDSMWLRHASAHSGLLGA
ncbi:MAG: LysR family transcriptional regulator [Curvibacter sp. GWA2_64_110]|nr:MAG: LysR family transcriptional regulator [Curvibacter sp. GWA2_64_110]HCY15058.1 LysR family transcriptional regulator [Curvibacter sp.]